VSLTSVFSFIYAVMKAIPVVQEAFFGFIDWWYKTQSEADTKKLKEALTLIQKPEATKEEVRKGLRDIVRSSF